MVVRVVWLGTCGEGACVKAVVEKVVAVVVVIGGWPQNNDSKRIMANSKITALLTRIIPFNIGGEIYLNTHLSV